jgi:hypothetical protein
MPKQTNDKVVTVTNADAGTAPLGDTQNDFEMRSKQAHDELKAVLDKYQLGIGAQLNIEVTGVTPKAVYIDLKKPNA